MIRAILAAGCVVSACVAPPVATKRAPIETAPELAMPAPATPREVRFYRDDKGVLWDDSGKRQEPAT